MSKLFVAVSAALMLAAFGTHLTADCLFARSSPATPEADELANRSQIISDVIDGQRSLFDGVRAFRYLDRDSPGLVERYPGDTQDEKTCWRVIAWVRARLASPTADSAAQEQSEVAVDPAAAVLARLEAEVAMARDRDANLHLPQDAR
jgi:hypothetical protein